MLLLDVCDNLPRLPISEALMRTFIWILRECGAKDVPSLNALRKTQKSLRAACGVPTIPFTSEQGKNFYVNDPKAIIRMECANPEIRSQFHLYPEINTNGSVSELWHGEKLCKQLNPDFLTPMFDAGNGIHYYTHEVAQLKDGRMVIPYRWIKVDGLLHADAYLGAADVEKATTRIPASFLALNFLDLEFKNQLPQWSELTIKDGYRDRMPNPLRLIAKGNPFYTIFVDYFSDDVSGNRSKSWNKHWNAYMTNRSLPRQLLQHEFYVHFISTSQHASVPEQFKEFQKLIKQDMETEVDPIRAPDKTSSTGFSCYRVIVNTDPSDNPMQAKICSCMGAAANHACRKCATGGQQEERSTNEGYHAMFAPGDARSKDTILASVREQVDLACEGNEAELKKNYTASGIKDKYTEYWINDILSQFKVEVAKGESKEKVTEALKKWVEDNQDSIYSPFLTTDSFDPPRDTPIELLHTILLGVLKYLWHTTHTSWKPHQKKLFELRLQATNTSGLSIESIRAGYIVQYANSLIGRQFKVVLQSTVFQIHDLVDDNHFRAWKAIGDLAALLWVPEIGDMDEYCADLHVAIGNFLDSFAEIDPSKMISKVKTHLLTHAPSDVRLFGPLLGAITEAFESFNGEGVKYRVAGGEWPVKGEHNEIVWTRCGTGARQLMQEQPILQSLLGWKKLEVHEPGSVKLAPLAVIKGQHGRPRRDTIILRSTKASVAFNGANYELDSQWYRCKTVVSQSQEICQNNSWVVSASPTPTEDVAIGRIVDILQQTNSSDAIVIIEQFLVQPTRHDIFNMPFLTPRRREESVFLVLKPKDVKFSFNVQHDCSSGSCKASGKRAVLQERQATKIQESFVEHDSNIKQFIINTASLHNPHFIRNVLPRTLVKPVPLWDDRVLLHHQQAQRLRDSQKSPLKAAAGVVTAPTQKRKSTSTQKKSCPKRRRLAMDTEDTEASEDTQVIRQRAEESESESQSSDSESDGSGDDDGEEDGEEDGEDESGGDVRETRPLPRRSGLRVRLYVNYKD
ncbi:hypothetical protein K438DRAFT_1910920 [Mycena galopus ATCC 62051]|nr:hypothetical protein K438DRAFT_1910920 [Mycena galopus ATCC 62051]